MDKELTKIFTKKIRELVDNLDAGNSEINEEQAIKILEIVAHRPMSKEEASIYLNMSTSKFDNLVRDGIIPKGRKRIGFKELVWYKDELDKCRKRNKKHI